MVARWEPTWTGMKIPTTWVVISIVSIYSEDPFQLVNIVFTMMNRGGMIWSVILRWDTFARHFRPNVVTFNHLLRCNFSSSLHLFELYLFFFSLVIRASVISSLSSNCYKAKSKVRANRIGSCARGDYGTGLSFASVLCDYHLNQFSFVASKHIIIALSCFEVISFRAIHSIQLFIDITRTYTFRRNDNVPELSKGRNQVRRDKCCMLVSRAVCHS